MPNSRSSRSLLRASSQISGRAARHLFELLGDVVVFDYEIADLGTASATIASWIG